MIMFNWILLNCSINLDRRRYSLVAQRNKYTYLHIMWNIMMQEIPPNGFFWIFGGSFVKRYFGKLSGIRKLQFRNNKRVLYITTS